MSTNSEWGIYVETGRQLRNYFCSECRLYSGTLRVRTCTDRDKNIHREYKIVCERCGKNGPLHWSKNLAEHSWKAENPNGNEDYISKNLSDIIGKKDS